MGELSICPSCNKPVRWYPTERGKHMMVEPDEAGYSRGTQRAGTGNLAIIAGVAHVLKPGEEWTGRVYVSHYANCLEARRLTGDNLRKSADRAIAKVKRGL